MADKTDRIKLTKDNYKKLVEVFNQSHMQLVKWLLEKHPKVWHQYEDEKMGGMRLRMLKNETKKNKTK